MSKHLLLGLFMTLLISSYSMAENLDSFADKSAQHHIGLGIGLTYGGFGGRYVLSPIENLGIFLGLGYNLVDVSYNVGAIYSIPSKSRTQFYFSGMYGKNAVIKIEGAKDLSKSYSGASFGIGLKLKSLRDPGNYWDVGILLPLRSIGFEDDWQSIKDNPSYEITNDPWPVLINIGYNFKI